MEEHRMKTIALTVLILFTATACYAQGDMKLSITVPEAKIDRAKLLINCLREFPTSTPCTTKDIQASLEEYVRGLLKRDLKNLDNKATHRPAGKAAEKASRDSITDYDEVFQ